MLEVARRRARRACEAPALNALNEKLRDDFIRDAVAGVERWNRSSRRQGIAVPADGAAQGVPPPDRPARRARTSRPTAASSTDAEWAANEREWLPTRRGPRVRRVADGTRRRAGQVRELDRAAAARHQQPAGRLRVRAVRLSAGAPRRAPMRDGRGGDPPAPHRSGDLHPLQHLRGDLPGRRDHARRAQLRRRRRRSATAATRASRPARPARSTTGGRSRGATPTRSTSSSAGTRCRRSSDDRREPTRRPTCRTDVARITARRHRGPGRRGAAAVVGRASVRQPAYASRSRRSATVTGNFRLTGDGASQRHPPHRARLRRAPRFRCSRARRSASCRPAPTRRAGRTIVRLYSVASPRDGERPRYNNVALTVKRVTEDHDGKPVARRRVELPVRPREGRDGAGGRARTARPS